MWNPFCEIHHVDFLECGWVQSRRISTFVLFSIPLIYLSERSTDSCLPPNNRNKWWISSLHCTPYTGSMRSKFEFLKFKLWTFMMDEWISILHCSSFRWGVVVWPFTNLLCFDIFFSNESYFCTITHIQRKLFDLRTRVSVQQIFENRFMYQQLN